MQKIARKYLKNICNITSLQKHVVTPIKHLTPITFIQEHHFVAGVTLKAATVSPETISTIQCNRFLCSTFQCCGYEMRDTNDSVKSFV